MLFFVFVYNSSLSIIIRKVGQVLTESFNLCLSRKVIISKSFINESLACEAFWVGSFFFFPEPGLYLSIFFCWEICLQSVKNFFKRDEAFLSCKLWHFNYECLTIYVMLSIFSIRPVCGSTHYLDVHVIWKNFLLFFSWYALLNHSFLFHVNPDSSMVFWCYLTSLKHGFLFYFFSFSFFLVLVLVEVFK